MRLAIVVRQLGLWVLLRAVHATVAAVVGVAGGGPVLSPIRQPQPAVVILCVALGVVETLRRHERVLLGNLGIDWKQLACLMAGPALAMEGAIGAIGPW